MAVDDRERPQGALRRLTSPRWLWDGPLLLAAFGLATVGATRWWDTTAPLVSVLQTLGPFVFIGSLGLLVVALVARRALPALVSLVLVGVGLLHVVPWYVAAPTIDRETTPQLTVMSSNMWEGHARARQVVDAVRATRADVLMLQEVTPAAHEALKAVGIQRDLPYAVGEAKEGTAGTMILSSTPITLTDPGNDPAVTHSPFDQPVATIRVGEQRVTLRAVHTFPPVGRDIPRWRAGLRALQEWREKQPVDANLVMAGDFNAGSGHPGFRALQGDLVDAHRAAGTGWVRSWPYAGQRVPAFVQIDHLLSRGVSVADAGVVGVHGSDHALVWARYRLR